jgi:two-component system, cell cycle sensor histidine kinase and response regulator CckA
MGTYIYAGPGFQTVLDYEPHLLIGQPGAVLIHPDDVELVRGQWVSQYSRDIVPATIRFRHADATWRWIEIRWHRIIQDDHTYTLAISRDVTDEQHLEARLHQMQKLNSLGRLAAGVAHDVHNIMMGIEGCAALALAAQPLQAEIRADLQEIQHAAARANSLTDQLLGFARRTLAQPIVIDLHDLIDRFARLLRRIIGEDIELIIMPAASRPFIRVDPGQIEQVLMNLAVNARDAMPFGGQLNVETHNVILDHLHEQSGAEHILLIMRDTGIGIEPHILEHIFEPFFTTKQAGSSTGLGLAIYDQIIGQYGGHIIAVSEPGEGTTFSITLPQVIRGGTGQRATIDQTAALPGGSETILVVEDDPTVCTFVARLLRRQGYTLLTASDGTEALRVAQNYSQPIDLLLTDLVLPKMSGKAIAEQLKTLWPNLGVIIMSGYPNDILATYGPFDTVQFLPKPCSLELLANVVRAVLDSAKLAAAATLDE